MRTFQVTYLIGHLGADPELKYLPSGAAVTNFRIAVNRNRRDPQSGQAVEETEWFRIVAFDKLGEIAGEYLRKGQACYVEGRLQSRKYTDRDGIERTAVEIVASDLVLLDGRAADEDSGGPPGRRQPAPSASGIDPDDPPF